MRAGCLQGTRAGHKAALRGRHGKESGEGVNRMRLKQGQRRDDMSRRIGY